MLIIEWSLPREEERVPRTNDLLALLSAADDGAAARDALSWLAEHRAPRRWRRVRSEGVEAVPEVRHAASSAQGRRVAERSMAERRIESSAWTKWRFEWDDATPDLQHRAQLDELCICATHRAAVTPWRRRCRLRLCEPRSATARSTASHRARSRLNNTPLTEPLPVRGASGACQELYMRFYYYWC
ncbi:MAG: hypothetical protein U0935_24535 [Pirellulales bacterium]